MKAESLKALTDITEHGEQKIKIVSCNEFNISTKVNKEYSLSNNGLQKMCSIWIYKSASIRGLPNLKKHTNEDDNIKMEECRNIGNNSSFSKNNAINIKVHWMLMHSRKVKVEKRIQTSHIMMKMHVTNCQVRNANKEPSDLVERPFKKNNVGDRGKWRYNESIQVKKKNTRKYPTAITWIE